MEAAYRRAATGKRRVQNTAAERKGERQKLIQLLVSLGLFFIVFLGRGVFSAQSEQWERLITEDADFLGAFQNFGQDIAENKPVWEALGKLAAASFWGTQQKDANDITNETPAVTSVEIEPLSESAQHGLAHYREHGLRNNTVGAEDEQGTADPENEIGAAPEVVTATAQAYTAEGEALPRNVSYEYYELGLEKTVVPVMGTVTSGFEYRTSPIDGSREFHLALDIAAAKGTEIAAFADGVVRYIGESDDFGLYLMIDHDNGVATFYAHCSKLLVRKGDVVSCGDTIALVGDTGNATGYHLHFTIEKDDIRLNPAYYVDLS